MKKWQKQSHLFKKYIWRKSQEAPPAPKNKNKTIYKILEKIFLPFWLKKIKRILGNNSKVVRRAP